MPGIGGARAIIGSETPTAVLNVPPPTGDTSGLLDYSNIMSVLNRAPIGSRVQLANNGLDYITARKILHPPQVAVWGQLSSHIDRPAVAIQATAGFTDSCVWGFVDQATGGYSVISAQQNLFYMTIDCSLISSTTVDGINATGYVHGVTLQDVQVYAAPNHGLSESTNGSGTPFSWHFERVNVTQGGKFGISWATTDSTFIDCEVIGCANIGWNFAGSSANSKLDNCRSEFNLVGYAFTGAWAAGTGSGGMQLDNCSTDANTQDGVRITATGTVPLLISNLQLRRDGRNGGGGGGNYAGLNIAGSSIPVVVGTVTSYVGVSDDGSGTPSPQYGLSITATATNVTLGTYYLQGNTAGIHDDGSNTYWAGAGQVASGTTLVPVITPGFGVNSRQVASTGPAGYALVAGAANIFTWTAPADGRLHTITVGCLISVGTTQVGGAITVTTNALGIAQTSNVLAGSLAAGGHQGSYTNVLNGGQTVTIAQQAMTGGAATVAITLNSD